MRSSGRSYIKFSAVEAIQYASRVDGFSTPEQRSVTQFKAVHTHTHTHTLLLKNTIRIRATEDRVLEARLLPNDRTINRTIERSYGWSSDRLRNCSSKWSCDRATGWSSEPSDRQSDRLSVQPSVRSFFALFSDDNAPTCWASWNQVLMFWIDVSVYFVVGLSERHFITPFENISYKRAHVPHRCSHPHSVVHRP